MGAFQNAAQTWKQGILGHYFKVLWYFFLKCLISMLSDCLFQSFLYFVILHMSKTSLVNIYTPRFVYSLGFLCTNQRLMPVCSCSCGVYFSPHSSHGQARKKKKHRQSWHAIWLKLLLVSLHFNQPSRISFAPFRVLSRVVCQRVVLSMREVGIPIAVRDREIFFVLSR